VILWDVDTQVDFMHPDGKLYVPDAEEIAPALKRLVQAAREAGIVHVASADDHELTDVEISDEPDFKTTFPPHCMRGTPGALKIPETEQAAPVTIGLEPLAEHSFEGREFLVLKKSFDPFTNPNTDRLLQHLDPDEIVVFGVATDICNDAAVQGFLERGRKVRFVADAARGIDDSDVVACTTAWLTQGVRFTTVDEVIGSF
jgi:nicotinamidase/pyrazinamidase